MSTATMTTASCNVSYSDPTSYTGDWNYNHNYVNPYWNDNTTVPNRSWTLTTVPTWTFTYPHVESGSKKLSPKFHCIYCGTKDYEEDHKTTPQCPICGALMRCTDEA